MFDKKEDITIQAQPADQKNIASSEASPVQAHEGGAAAGDGNGHDVSEVPAADLIDTKKKGFLAYFTTKEFYIILILGWVSGQFMNCKVRMRCDG